MTNKFAIRDTAMLQLGMVPAQVCVVLTGYYLATLHRAVDSQRLKGERVQRRLYIDWTAFLGYVGAMAQTLPQTAAAAVEKARCE